MVDVEPHPLGQHGVLNAAAERILHEQLLHCRLFCPRSGSAGRWPRALRAHDLNGGAVPTALALGVSELSARRSEIPPATRTFS